MSELFDDLPESKSPRLLWMERYGVTLKDYGSDDKKRFEVCANGRCFYAESADQALTSIAIMNGLKLWNEEGGTQ